MRIVTRVLVLAVFAAGVLGAQPPERIALTVEERSGVARTGDAVTSGVPFPTGLGLVDADQAFGVVDGDGRPVPTQCSVITRWWKPAHDGSVRWLRVSFPATVDANGRADYALVPRKGDGSVEGLTVREDPDAWTIETRAATFTVPRGGLQLLTRAAVGSGESLIGPAGAGLVLTSGAWPELGVEAGARFVGFVDEATLEERGPVRAVVCLRGGFRKPGAERNEKWCYRFTVRAYFFVDSPEVRLVASLENSRLADDLYCAPVEDLSLLIATDVGADPVAQVLATGAAERVAVATDGEAKLYQDSSGGPEWRDLTRLKNYARWVSPYTKGDRVRGVTFSGYRLYAGKQVVGKGSHARGAIDLGGDRGGISAVQRNFRVRYPSCVAADARRIRLALWPTEFADTMFLETGQRVTREYRLRFRAPAEAPNLDRLHRVVDRRLMFRPDPKWVVASDAWDAGLAFTSHRPTPRRQSPKKPATGRAGPKPAPAGPTPQPTNLPPWKRTKSERIVPLPGGGKGKGEGGGGGGGAAAAPAFDKDALDGIDAGWDWYGWIKGFNIGGAHWNQNTCFANWVLHGDAHEFDFAEARTLWAADRVTIHYRDVDMARYWLFLQNWRWPDTRVRYHRFPDYYRRSRFAPAEIGHQNANPDNGHLAMFMWFEYYCLTGDRHVLDSCLAIGRRGRAYMWRHNHRDTVGAAKNGRRVSWCKPRDPNDPAFRLDTRYVGWPLYLIASLYQLTGDPEVAADGKNIAAGLRNTARLSPIGFLSLHINEPGSKRTYGGKLDTGPPPTDSASIVYANFQVGVIASGLAHHYRETGDEEALDALIGISDLFTHHAMIRDGQGKMLGWPYVFGDYWGPYSLSDFDGRHKPGWFQSNFRIVQPLGWTYRFTGRRDYLDVLDAALQALQGSAHRVLAACRARSAPRPDATPPRVVSDLRAGVDGTAVVLEWTAPEGAARYQLKRARAPIVERVSGWPDRTPPLPRDTGSWVAKASAFNARQRAFWAAENVPGEPAPAPQSDPRQRFRIDGLEPGVHYFALKSWDESANMSALSNVVRVEVPGR